MPDPRLTWYCQRAKEEGEQARWQMLTPYLWERIETAVRHAREAAHYGNLVLGPEPRGGDFAPHRWTPDPTKRFCVICGDNDLGSVWGLHRFEPPLRPTSEA